jgi:hypothetical protein
MPVAVPLMLEDTQRCAAVGRVGFDKPWTIPAKARRPDIKRRERLRDAATKSLPKTNMPAITVGRGP